VKAVFCLQLFLELMLHLLQMDKDELLLLVEECLKLTIVGKSCFRLNTFPLNNKSFSLQFEAHL